MRKRLLASLLSLVMVLTMLPAAALAADPPEEAAPVEDCICTELCTVENINGDCPVCGVSGGFAACAYTETEAEPPATALAADGDVYTVSSAAALTEALEKIAASGDREATIQLTTGIAMADNHFGVSGKHITVVSNGENSYELDANSSIHLSGDVTFHRQPVRLRLHRGVWRELQRYRPAAVWRFG